MPSNVVFLKHRSLTDDEKQLIEMITQKISAIPDGADLNECVAEIFIWAHRYKNTPV